MQFKFFVDGEWRHDDHQPFVSGNYGVVNTVFLPREPDMVPAVFSSDTPGGSNMDLDSDPFPHGVRDFSQQSLWFCPLATFTKPWLNVMLTSLLLLIASKFLLFPMKGIMDCICFMSCW